MPMETLFSQATEAIKREARALLESGEVAAFLGFAKGSIPTVTRPFVARSPEETDKLIWNGLCVMNLANYLPGLLKSLEPARRPGEPPPEGPLPKVGVIATGCWSRNMVIQIQENQLIRERLVILGIDSPGMIDRRKLESLAGGKEIQAIEEAEKKVVISGKGFRLETARQEVLRDNCLTCTHPSPVILDKKIGPTMPERHVHEPFARIEEIERMDADSRWAWFQKEIECCIRCYACRNACPLCYCPTCFVDDSHPQWVGKSVDPVDTAIFHILRAYHCAGRCTDCGACESACPMGIKMRLFTRKLQKDCLELFASEPGLDINSPLPLTTYGPEDPERFIINGSKQQGTQGGK